jgi:hypothetical protein
MASNDSVLNNPSANGPDKRVTIKSPKKSKRHRFTQHLAINLAAAHGKAQYDLGLWVKENDKCFEGNCGCRSGLNNQSSSYHMCVGTKDNAIRCRTLGPMVSRLIRVEKNIPDLNALARQIEIILSQGARAAIYVVGMIFRSRFAQSHYIALDATEMKRSAEEPSQMEYNLDKTLILGVWALTRRSQADLFQKFLDTIQMRSLRKVSCRGHMLQITYEIHKALAREKNKTSILQMTLVDMWLPEQSSRVPQFRTFEHGFCLCFDGRGMALWQVDLRENRPPAQWMEENGQKIRS